MSSEIQFKIADLVLKAQYKGSDIDFALDPPQVKFSVENIQPDCLLDVYYQSFPEIQTNNLLFDQPGGSWKLYDTGTNYLMQLVAQVNGENFIHREIYFSKDFHQGEMYILPTSEIPDENLKKQQEIITTRNPFVYPIDIFILINLLSRFNGLAVHSAGVKYDDCGYLFCGISGAGKSTLAKLWQARGAIVLSDEKNAMRRIEDNIVVYGTPWQSSAKLYSPDQAPLKAIYFLKQSKYNRIVPLTNLEATSRIVLCSYMPFYLKESIEGIMGFLDTLLCNVPMFEFEFTPDQRAIDEVVCHADNLKS